MSEPGAQTSNYGWALWHLSKVNGALPEDAAIHAACAQARATLQLAVETAMANGVRQMPMTTWGGDTNEQ